MAKTFNEIILSLLIIAFVALSAKIAFGAQVKCHITSELDQAGNKVVKCVSGFIPPDSLGLSPIDPDTGKQIRTSRIVVDDYRPLRESPKFVDCSDSSDCVVKAALVDCPFGGTPKFDEKVNLLPLTVPGDPLEEWVIWCEKKQGFKFDRAKKDVVLAERAAAQAAEEAKIQDLKDRHDRKRALRTELKKCFDESKGVVSESRFRECVTYLYREVASDEFDVGDLKR